MDTLRRGVWLLGRGTARGACLVLIMGVAGCATKPRRPPLTSTEAGHDLGRIAVSFDTESPDLVIVNTPVPKGRASVLAARKAAGVLFTVGSGRPESALLATLLAPAVIGGGAVYGAVAAVPKRELASATSSMEQGREELRINDHFRGALEKELACVPENIPELVFGAGDSDHTWAKPRLAEPESPASPGRDAVPCDTMLRIRIPQFGLFGSSAINPKLRLYVLVEARMLRSSDSAEVGIFFAEYETKGHRFTAWSADNARILRVEYDRAVKALATRLITWLSGGPVPPPIMGARR